MTNSFQSTAFQSSARPVDTFVRPPSVQPKTGIESLAEALAIVNPNLQKFIGQKIQGIAKTEASQGVIDEYKKALTPENVSDTAEEFGAIVDSVRKNDGDEAAKEFAGRSIWYKDAAQKTKASLAGSDALSNLLSSYNIDTIDGKPLRTFSPSDPKIINYQQEKLNQAISNLDVDEYYAAEFFFPQLQKASDAWFQHHQKQNSLYNIEDLQGKATEVVQQVYTQWSLGYKDEAKLTASNYITNVRKLLKGKNYTEVQDLLIDDIKQVARIIGFTSDEGDQEAQKFIDEIIEYFPSGPNGTRTLGSNKNFLNMRADLLFELDTFTRAKNKRIEAEKLQASLEEGRALLLDPDTTAEQFREFKLANPGVIKDLNEFALETQSNSNQELADIYLSITRNEFATPLAAAEAARAWYNGTLKTQKDKTELKTLTTAINRNINGSANPIRQSIARITKASDNLLSDVDTGLFSQEAIIAKVDIDDYVQNTMFNWFLSFERNGQKATPIDEEIIRKELEVKKEAQQRAVDFLRSEQGPGLDINIEQLRDSTTRQRLLRIKKRIETGIKTEATIEQISEQSRVSVDEVKRLIGTVDKSINNTDATNTNQESNTTTNQDTPARPNVIPNPNEGFRQMSDVNTQESPGIQRINKTIDMFNGAVSFGSGKRGDNLAKDPAFITTIQKEGFSHTYADSSPPEVIAEMKNIYKQLVTDTSLKSSQDKLAIAQMVMTEAIPTSEQDMIGVMSTVLARVARARLGLRLMPGMGSYEKDIIDEILRKDQFVGVKGVTREQLINAKPIKGRTAQDLQRVIYVLFNQGPRIDT